jgi:hypothetical protein
MSFADSFSFRRFSSPLVDTLLLCWLAADAAAITPTFSSSTFFA